MKKILFCLTAFITISLTAQNVIWSDDFEDLDISDWTLLDEDGDGQNWYAIQTANQGTPINTPGLRSASWAAVPLTPDNWAITPEIDLSGETGSVILKWEVWGPDANYSNENYSVYVATSNSVSDFLASEISFNEIITDNGPGGSDNIYSKELDISTLAGEKVYVAFRHHDVSDQFAIIIDNVSVESNGMSTSDVNVKSASIYPNPVVDAFSVNVSSKFNENNLSVTISDLSGKTVKSFEKASSYDVSSLPAGIYVVKISDGKLTETTKLVKK